MITIYCVQTDMVCQPSYDKESEFLVHKNINVAVDEGNDALTAFRKVEDKFLNKEITNPVKATVKQIKLKCVSIIAQSELQ